MLSVPNISIVPILGVDKIEAHKQNGPRVEPEKEAVVSQFTLRTNWPCVGGIAVVCAGFGPTVLETTMIEIICVQT